MTQDIFKEQIVKRKTQPKDLVLKCIVVFAYFAIAIVLNTIAHGIGLGGMGLIIYLGAAFLGYMTLGRSNVEYEYSVTNGDLDIDIIINKKSRKRALSINAKNIEVMAHSSQNQHITQSGKTRYYTSRTTDDTYTFVIKEKNEYVKIVFEPNEGIIEAIGKKMSRSKLHLK